jgi:hypothetical protein
MRRSILSSLRRLPARLRTTSLVAAIAAKSAAAAAAITAKAAAPIFAWTSFVDFQGATANFFAVELFNR